MNTPKNIKILFISLACLVLLLSPIFLFKFCNTSDNFQGCYIGIAHNTSAHLFADALIQISDKNSIVDGSIKYGSGLIGAGDFTTTKEGNSIKFYSNGINYEMVLTAHGIEASYVTSNLQEGKILCLKVSDELYPNNVDEIIKCEKISAESLINEDNEFLSNIAKSLGIAGNPIMVEVKKVEIGDSSELFVMSLLWITFSGEYSDVDFRIKYDYKDGWLMPEKVNRTK